MNIQDFIIMLRVASPEQIREIRNLLNIEDPDINTLRVGPSQEELYPKNYPFTEEEKKVFEQDLSRYVKSIIKNNPGTLDLRDEFLSRKQITDSNQDIKDRETE